ncbi:hypothetical protein DM02DRAFT_624908 [Periconia macrospinosa]|uniref:RING-type domain-containing protein n=1 Tax=Periconia macrospinosa TaxID=97972 RepID=A0A2V1E1H3_9PLEO|nr:hypothetical protein DM02DRAFT_624908 [Periconia macrospinosa]
MNQVSRDQYLSLHGRHMTLCGPPSEPECPICVDAWDEETMTIVTIHCGHIFHEECIREWFSTPSDSGIWPNTCPICRAQCFNPIYTPANVEDGLRDYLHEYGLRFRSIMAGEVRLRRGCEVSLTISRRSSKRFLHAVDRITRSLTGEPHTWMSDVRNSFTDILPVGFMSRAGERRIIESVVRGLVTVSIISEYGDSMRSSEWVRLIKELRAIRIRANSSENAAGDVGLQQPPSTVELFDTIWMGLVMVGPSPRFETGYSLEGLHRLRSIRIASENNIDGPGVSLDEDWLWDNEPGTRVITAENFEFDLMIEIRRAGNVRPSHPRQTLTFIEHSPGTIRDLFMSHDGSWLVATDQGNFRISFLWGDTIPRTENPTFVNDTS